MRTSAAQALGLLAGSGKALGEIKGRQVDDADAVRRFFRFAALFDDIVAGLLRFQLDFLPRQVDDDRLDLARRDHLQTHLAAPRPADELDHLPQFHIHRIHQDAVGLGHGHDLVLGLESAICGRRSAGNHLDHHCLAVVRTEQGANAVQFRRMAMLKSSSGRRRHVGGVRIDTGGQVGQVHFHEIVIIHLLVVLEQTLVALAALFSGPRRPQAPELAELVEQQVELDPFPPALTDFVVRGRKVQGVRIGLEDTP